MFGFFKRRRRERLLAEPFPAAWLEIIERNVRFYACLPDADRRELQGLVQIFLAEKTFEGCGGLELTDEMKVTIAAQACLLLLHRQTDIYPRLVTILVYPSAYLAKAVKPIGGPVVLEDEVGPPRRVVDQRGGRSVLERRSGRRSRTSTTDRTSCLHEFAHQLDREDGAINGTPLLEQRSQYLAWGRVLNAEYERLQARQPAGAPHRARRVRGHRSGRVFRRGHRVLLREAQSAQKRHPALYDELKAFYRQDPAQLLPTAAISRPTGELT